MRTKKGCPYSPKKQMKKDVEYRHRLIEKGLCTKCKNPNDRGKGWYCSKCLITERERHKENREFYISLGLCSQCGKEKVFGNEKLCPICRAKNYESTRKKVEKYGWKKPTEERREKIRNRYNELKELGICTACRKRKAVVGRTKCGVCLEKESTRARLKHKPLKTDFSEGLCIRCNNPVVPGYKQCEFHHAISIKAGKASAERRRELANG